MWPWARPSTSAVWQPLCRKMWQHPPGRELRLSNYTLPYKCRMLVKSIWGPTAVKEGFRDRRLLFYLKASVQWNPHHGESSHMLNLATNEENLPAVHHQPTSWSPHSGLFKAPGRHTLWAYKWTATPHPQNYPNQLPSLCLLLLHFFGFLEGHSGPSCSDVTSAQPYGLTSLS